MRFEWDAEKSRANLRKHRIAFETAQLVFDDPHGLSVQDRTVSGEERWQTLGLIRGKVIVLVAHTWREEEDELVVRIISARRASPAERRAYEEARESTS